MWYTEEGQTEQHTWNQKLKKIEIWQIYFDQIDIIFRTMTMDRKDTAIILEWHMIIPF